MRRNSLTAGGSATAHHTNDADRRMVIVGAHEPGDSKFELALDRDWRIISITESAAAWAGSTVGDLIGRQCQDLNPAATKLLTGPIEAAFARGVTTSLEHPSTHVPGRWVRIEVAPSDVGARIRFEDITSPDPGRRCGRSRRRPGGNRAAGPAGRHRLGERRVAREHRRAGAGSFERRHRVALCRCRQDARAGHRRSCTSQLGWTRFSQARSRSWKRLTAGMGPTANGRVRCRSRRCGSARPPTSSPSMKTSPSAPRSSRS